MLKKMFISYCLVSSFSLLADSKVIYGEDNREEVYDSASEYARWSESTAAMIEKRKIVLMANGSYQINGAKFSEQGMCQTERFLDQPTAADCSGFLVGNDLLVTAGHCIRSMNDCSRYKWVFDYKMNSSEQVNSQLQPESIYSCVEVISRALNSRGDKNDYALIRLDRKVEGREALKFRKKSLSTNLPDLEVGTSLVVIGHPSGLPTKIADGASVRSNSNGIFFTANLDTYGGNSGSAVINTQTGEVEGILVRGEIDFINEDGCRVSKKCSDLGCRGEDVTRITAVEALR